MLSIEADVPIPPRMEAVRLYPFAALEIGQSFLADKSSWASVRVQAVNHGKRLGRTFRTRKVNGGIRVWRIA